MLKIIIKSTLVTDGETDVIDIVTLLNNPKLYWLNGK